MTLLVHSCSFAYINGIAFRERGLRENVNDHHSQASSSQEFCGFYDMIKTERQRFYSLFISVYYFCNDVPLKYFKAYGRICTEGDDMSCSPLALSAEKGTTERDNQRLRDLWHRLYTEEERDIHAGVIV
ncbi:hypothetical protein KP509_34G014300 [Ceratopteris richardii]|uniref:Uncharacterized protein n=1 Tax=Ceratopteris richardii TaxID=49495 RepID=A0A8T2QIY1_CERRI|nr:hypothetical protein KP509_34G014300 [Ceratopteris richardii]